jgi:hypothetical protein
MDIVLGLLAAYALGGSIWPQIVRQRQFFLLGAAGVMAAILLQSFNVNFLHFVGRIVEVATFAVFMVAAGGGTLDQYWRGFSFRNLR